METEFLWLALTSQFFPGKILVGYFMRVFVLTLCSEFPTYTFGTEMFFEFLTFLT